MSVSRSAERAERMERRFDIPMMVAALLVIPVVLIESSSVSGGWRDAAAVLNWLIWLAFLLELVTMLLVVPARGSWLRSHPLETAIVVLTPPFLPAALQALRFFRLLRPLRVVVVAREFKRVFSVEGIRFAAVLAGVAALGGGAIFSSVEQRGYSMWDGVWWAMTTMATVGYGDLAPTTVIGRFVAVALMIIGIGFFALLTGAVAQRFIASNEEETVEAAQELVAHDVEAARDEMLREIRSIAARLAKLEQAMTRM